MTSTVVRFTFSKVKNKYRVHLDCGHVLVIDATVDDPAQFDRRCKVLCLECKRIGNYELELGGEA